MIFSNVLYLLQVIVCQKLDIKSKVIALNFIIIEQEQWENDTYLSQSDKDTISCMNKT